LRKKIEETSLAAGLRGRTLSELGTAIAERRAILFAGAGITMSVGLPSWDELLAQIGMELDIDPRALLGPDLSYHTLAEFYRIKRGSIGPLRSWMDRHWSVSEKQVVESEVHRIIVELDFPIIYTTNYDRNLEVAFRAHGKPFVKISNASDITKIRENETQIVKFHGDFDDDASLVFAETDYLERLAFNSPLDVKFRADAMASTILFVGYSMSDLNIRLLLYRIWKTWRESGYEHDRPRSYVLMIQPNPVQEAVMAQWGITPIIAEGEAPSDALLAFLRALRRETGVTTDE
jgi:hypothetical protein